jgi:high-affinity iron transporter
MTAAYLITFREGLEAALIVGILLSCARVFKTRKVQAYVWGGVLMGLILSLIFAYVFSHIIGGFEGTVEKVYEGVLMLGAAALITHLVVWMRHRGKGLEDSLNKKIVQSVEAGTLWMIAFIAMMSVVREGVETVIFFQALMAQAGGDAPILSGVLGVLSAVLLAVIIFYTTKKVPVKSFFQYTAYFLALIAAGLLGHGIVELQGAHWLPTVVKPLYDISSVLPESEGVGALLKAGFGYDANPSLLAVLGYLIYLALMARWMWKIK